MYLQEILSLVKKHYDVLILRYSLEINQNMTYEIQLANKTTTVILSFNKYYDDLQTFFLNNKKKQSIGLINILFLKNLIGVKVLNTEESILKNSLDSELEKKIYVSSIILKKYFTDILEGDFSIIDNNNH